MSHAKAGTLGWVDLTVSDAARARDFYAAVCDLTPRDHAMGDYADFDMIGAEGAVVTGVCHAKGANAGVPPVWIPYFTVATPMARPSGFCRHKGPATALWHSNRASDPLASDAEGVRCKTVCGRCWFGRDAIRRSRRR